MHRVHEEKESAVIILKFSEIVGFLFRFLQQIAFAVTAFGNSQIIQISSTGKIVRCKRQVVNQLRRIDRVFAVIPCIMVATGNINGTRAQDRVKLGFHRSHPVAGVAVTIAARDGAPGILKFRGTGGDAGCRNMAGRVGVAAVGQRQGDPTALVVEPLSVHPGKVKGHVRINLERQRAPKPVDFKLIVAGGFDGREVGGHDFLIGQGRGVEANVCTGGEDASEDNGTGGGVNDSEGCGGNVQFTGAAKVVADHRLFRSAGGIPDLVDVDRRVAAIAGQSGRP